MKTIAAILFLSMGTLLLAEEKKPFDYSQFHFQTTIRKVVEKQNPLIPEKFIKPKIKLPIGTNPDKEALFLELKVSYPKLAHIEGGLAF